MQSIKNTKIPAILFILFLTVAVLNAGETYNQNLSSKAKPDVDFSGYSENELDSLAYYCMGRGLSTFNGYSKIEEKLYKVDIHPQTPKEGITTGYALLYGHYVKPPYKFEIFNDTILYLNGIQIDPPIKNKVKEIARAWYSKRAKEKAESEGLTPYMDEVESLLKKAESTYKALISKRGQKKVIDSITKLFKSDTFLYRFGIAPLEHDAVTGTLIIKKPVDGTLTKIGFTFYPTNPYNGAFTKPKDEAERIRWRRESIEGLIKSGEEKLKQGGTLYGSSGTNKEYVLPIYRIMSNFSFNIFMKVDELKKIEPVAGFYKQIIYNYSQGEYHDIEKRGQK